MRWIFKPLVKPCEKIIAHSYALSLLTWTVRFAPVCSWTGWILQCTWRISALVMVNIHWLWLSWPKIVTHSTHRPTAVDCSQQQAAVQLWILSCVELSWNQIGGVNGTLHVTRWSTVSAIYVETTLLMHTEWTRQAGDVEVSDAGWTERLQVLHAGVTRSSTVPSSHSGVLQLPRLCRHQPCLTQ